MKTFEYFMPTKVFFGNGEIAKAGILTKEIGHRALVVTGKQAMKSAGILTRLLGYLEAEGVEATVFDKVSPNPRVEEIEAGARYCRKHRCDMIIGLGGGSAIDGAKAIAVAAGYNKSIREFMSGEITASGATLPIISIPTTAGTGAEVTKRAILSDVKRRVKQGIQGAGISPKVAIVDPELTLSVPSNVTAETGFDVLCHAIETYISKKAQPITVMFSEEAIRIVSENLPKVWQDGNNLDCRTKMMFASLLMGFNLTNSSNCLPHRLQYPIGARTDGSHATGLASLFLVWLQRVALLVPQKLARVAELMGADLSGLSISEAAQRSIDLVKALLTDIGLNIRLRDLGISYEECPQLADEVTGNLEADPSFQSREDILELYRAAW